MPSFSMFHASKHAYEAPDYDFLAANRENHQNGLLGLWVSAKSDWITGFGEHVYAVEFDGESIDLTVGELMQWSRATDDDFYVQKRNELLAQGVTYIRLIEQDGRSEMGVVVNFSAIQKFQPITARTIEILAKPQQVKNDDGDTMNKESLLKIWLESSPTARSPYALYGNPPMWETLTDGDLVLFTRPGKTMERPESSIMPYREVNGVHYQWQLNGKWFEQGYQCSFEYFESEFESIKSNIFALKAKAEQSALTEQQRQQHLLRQEKIVAEINVDVRKGDVLAELAQVVDGLEEKYKFSKYAGESQVKDSDAATKTAFGVFSTAFNIQDQIKEGVFTDGRFSPKGFVAALHYKIWQQVEHPDQQKADKDILAGGGLFLNTWLSELRKGNVKIFDAISTELDGTKMPEKNEPICVNVIAANGQVMSTYETDSPQEAMEEFIATSKVGFGEMLGVGSHLALLDPAQKIDAALVYEGENCYRQQFAKDEGLHLHAQLVGAPILRAIDPSYTTMLQVSMEAAAMARGHYLAALNRQSKYPMAEARTAALVVVTEDAEQRLMRASAAAQNLTFEGAQSQYRSEFADKNISFSMDDIAAYLRGKAGRSDYDGDSFSESLAQVAARISEKAVERVHAENRLLGWLSKDVSELLRGMAPVELKDALTSLQAMSPISAENPFWAGRQLADLAFNSSKLEVATDLAYDLVDEYSAAACNRQTYTYQAGKICHDYLLARAGASGAAECAEADFWFTQEFQKFKRDRDYLQLPVDKQVRGIDAGLELRDGGYWRVFPAIVDLAKRYGPIDETQDPRFCSALEHNPDQLLLVSAPDMDGSLLYRDIATGREYVVPDVPENRNTAQRAANLMTQIALGKNRGAPSAPLESQLFELLDKARTTGLALSPYDVKMAQALEAMRNEKGPAREKAQAKFQRLCVENFRVSIPKDWDGTVSAHPVPGVEARYQIQVGFGGGQRPQVLMSDLQASQAHGISLRLSLANVYATFRPTLALFEKMRSANQEVPAAKDPSTTVLER